MPALLQTALAPHQLHLVVGRPDLAGVSDLVDQLDELVVSVDNSRPACEDGKIVRRELINAALLARHGALRLLGKAVPGDLEDAIAEYEACWLARSRPGGLGDSLVHLHTTLAEERSS